MQSKMKNERYKLEEKLGILLQQKKLELGRRELKNLMVDGLEKYMDREKIKQIALDEIPFTSLDQKELYLVALFAKEKLELKINLDEWFDSSVATAAINNKKQVFNYVGSGLTFHDVLYNGDDNKPEWILYATYKQIHDWWEGSAITYNLETQREAKLIKVGNSTYKQATIHPEKVEAIKKLMLSGDFENNTITLNIRKTGLEKKEYDQSRNRLTIWIDKKTTYVDIPDGAHRVTAIVQTIRENPDAKGIMKICIKNLDVEETRKFILQESKGNTEDISDLYDTESNLFSLIDKINKTQGFLNDKIETIYNQNDDVYIKSAVLVEAIKHSWIDILNDANDKDIFNYKSFIAEYYDWFYDALKEKYNANNYEDLKMNKPELFDEMFMSGVIISAYYYYEQSKDLNPNIVEDIARKINYGKESTYNPTVMTYENKRNNKSVKAFVNKWKRITGKVGGE